MDYTYPLYRPPSEGSNLILQVTEGCSFNRCSFCSMYRSKTFSEKPLENVLADIKTASYSQPETRRIFLADGDALHRSTSDLLTILSSLYEAFPKLTRVSSYALPNNLMLKKPEELQTLKSAGLQLLYYGIETGSDELLKCITKGASSSRMIEGIHKAMDAGLKISATVILGLGGQRYWQEHIEETARLINKLNLNYLSTLQLTLGEDIYDEYFEKFKRRGRAFIPQSDGQMLQEQQQLISLIKPKNPVIFRSNHASNALPLKGTLPKDCDKLLQQLEIASYDESQLIPRWLRGL